MIPKFLEKNPPHGRKSYKEAKAERNEKIRQILEEGVATGRITEDDMARFYSLDEEKNIAEMKMILGKAKK